MKLRDKLSLIVTYLIVILISLSLFTKAFAVSEPQEYYRDLPAGNGPVNWGIENWYCREHGKPTKIRDQYGNQNNSNDYKYTDTTFDEIEPMTGYGLWFAQKFNMSWSQFKNYIQNIIWQSKNFEIWYDIDSVVVEDDCTPVGLYDYVETLVQRVPGVDSDGDGDVDGDDDQDGDGIANKDEVFDKDSYEDGRKFKDGDPVPVGYDPVTGEYYEVTEEPIDPEPIPILERSRQFGIVWYALFRHMFGVSMDRKELFTTHTNKEDLKVLVDQEDQTYTVGPYTIELNIEEEGLTEIQTELLNEAEVILYNELVEYGNECFSSETAFAKFTGITGINGTDVVLVDGNGQEIKCPDFVNNEEFYIRFKPNNEGNIETTGDPVLHFEYMCHFDGLVHVYQLCGMKFTYYYEEMAADDLNGRNPDTSVTITEGAVTYDVKQIPEYNDPDDPTKITGYHWGPDYTKPLYQVGSADVTATLKLQLKVQDEIAEYTCATQTFPVRRDYSNGAWGEWYYTSVHDVEFEIPEDFIEQWNMAEEVQKCSLIVLEWDTEEPFEHTWWWMEMHVRWCRTNCNLPGKEILERLAGHVWEEKPSIKEAEIDGRYNSSLDVPYSGMLVTLYEAKFHNMNDVRVFGETVTDENGAYSFENLNPLRKYYVVFTYNGQYYQSTYYKYDLSGGFSNARDIGRTEFNAKFKKIDSTPKNYKTNEWHEAYARESKLRDNNNQYIAYNGGALTYNDAWVQFREFALQSKSYTGAYTLLNSWMGRLGVNATERANVIKFMQDSMITASTNVTDPLGNFNCPGFSKVVYPVYNQFVLEDIDNPPATIKKITLDKVFYYLYTQKSDQSRYVDYGVDLRKNANLALMKDIYKASVFLNGQKHDYLYEQKNPFAADEWTVNVRISDGLYNGSNSYRRAVRPSEILMDGSDIYGSADQDVKNLKVLLTYKIMVKNTGSVDASVNEIVDYYDATQYKFDGTLSTSGMYSPKVYNTYNADSSVASSYINTYQFGQNASNITGNAATTDLKISNHTSFAERESSKTLQGQNYNYSSIYITGIKTNKQTDGVYVLQPDEMIGFYITFEVNKDTSIEMLDQDVNTGVEKIGKRNIAEINGYSTYYGSNYKIPGNLDNNNGKVDNDVSNTPAGLIDYNSKAGSLAEVDLDPAGNIISSTDPTVDRHEDDTDKAPNFKLVVEEGNPRTITGYTYEDARTENSNKAVVGNGTFDNNDTKINGVTVQLVELVREVDSNNVFTGKYVGEHIWASQTYDTAGNLVDVNNDVYYSGIGYAKVIINGNGGILSVDAPAIDNNGSYSFVSIPGGNFFVRFIYGDSERTVLTSDANQEVNKLIGKTGMNAKSYNGQDYKSTVYQAGVSTDGSYMGINGFVNKDVQNYNNDGNQNKVDTNGAFVNGADKSAMYLYNIGASAAKTGVSDAKDVYAYRKNQIDYSTTQQNYKAEVLDSFEKLGTYTKTVGTEEQKTIQTNMLNELIRNTFMVAQSGVIDLEIEYNTNVTTGQNTGNHYAYLIDDLDFGIVERPEAQLVLNKEVSRFRIVLANGETLFDASQSVNNLYFKKHAGHASSYNGYRMNAPVVNDKNTTDSPELIQCYMDDEIIAGSTVQITYKLTVTNVGEVDYLDKTFYYTGRTVDAGDSNIARTSADTVIDYLTNSLRFQREIQETGAEWNVESIENLIPSTTSNGIVLSIDSSKIGQDLVNRKYYNEVASYNAALTTSRLTNNATDSDQLLPKIANRDKASASTTLIGSTITSSDASIDSLVYNNIAEIVKVRNEQGRRIQYSIVGNQEMSNQNLGNDTRSDIYTSVDLVTPTEVDADSAQLVRILPPTGENRQYVPIIITALGVVFIIGTGVIVFKKRLGNNGK